MALDKKDLDEIKKLFKEDEESLSEKNSRLREELKETAGLFGAIRRDMNETTREINTLVGQTKKAAENFKQISEEYRKALDKTGLTDEEVQKYEKLKQIFEKLTQKEKLGIISDKEKVELGDISSELKDIESKHTDINDLLNLRNGQFKAGNILLEKEKETLLKSNSAIKQGFGEIKQGFSQVHGIAKDFMGVWGEIDKSASKFAKSIGVSAAGMRALRANTIQAVAQGRFGAKYNVDAKDLIGIQENYTKEIGRNAILSSSDQENMAAMSAVLGENGAKLAAAFEKFGLSYTNAADRAGKMFETASKYGISFDKYTQNVQEGLKIAQEYTFSNGVRGMQEMAKKATAIRLDMQQISAFAKNVNTLQGATETASKLQVLGGPFAQMADPLGMLSDSINGIEGLLDRFAKMTGGLGRFNAQTGEMEVSAFNKRRLQVAAEAMGMSYDQVMESVLAQGRQKYVGNILATRNYQNKEDVDFLKNVATIENGQATVSYIDENNNKQRVNLSERDLTKKELELIKRQNQSQSDNIKDIAQQLRSWEDVKEGMKKQYNNNKAMFLEKSGVAEETKKISKKIGTSNALLSTILSIVTLTQGGTAVKNLIGGGKNLVGGIRGKNSANEIIKKTLGEEVAGVAGNRKLTGGLGTTVGSAAVLWGVSRAAKQNQDRQNGVLERGSKEDRHKTTGTFALIGGGVGLAGVGSAVALGATLGSTVPIIGTAIGTVIGAAVGLGVSAAINKVNKEAKKRKDSLSAQGYSLRGDYKNRELKEIQEALRGDGTITKNEFSLLSKKTQDKLLQSGDASLFPDLAEIVAKTNETSINTNKTNITADSVIIEKRGRGSEEKANGGLLKGPSHRNGGMSILGSNIEVEGGEFVVNKRATAKNLGLLNTINTMGEGGIVKPRKMETGGALKVASVGVNSVTTGVNNIGVQDINLNINGTIKLEGNNGQNVDITNELLKNPSFIRNITKMIEEQMGINKTGGRLVNKGLY